MLLSLFVMLLAYSETLSPQQSSSPPI